MGAQPYECIEKLRASINTNIPLWTKSDLVTRFNIVYGLMKLDLDFLLAPGFYKNDTVAIFYREEGNRYYNIERYADALKFYTASITSAETKAVMSLAYANRAAIFYYWNKVEECSCDLDRAMDLTSDDVVRCELASRKIELSAVEGMIEEYYDLIPCFPESRQNKLIENAGDNIKMSTNEIQGRHIVACKNLEIGDVLVAEKAVVAVLTVGNFLHCHECFELCYNPIPCNTCTDSVYCSESCKKKSENYHKYECVVKRKLTGQPTRDGERLALKLTILMKIDRKRYYKIFDMMHHLDKILEHDLLLVWLSRSVAIYHILKTCSDYFNNPNSSRDENIFKESIIKNWAVVNWNSLSITDLAKSRSTIYSSEVIGTGLFSSMSFFNHSCCPNVMTISYGDIIVARAIRSIKIGEQCYISYGFTYANTALMQRKLLINRHFFICYCKSCVQNWPLYAEIVNENSELQSAASTSSKEDFMAVIHKAKNSWKTSANALKDLENKGLSSKFYLAAEMAELCFRAYGNRRLLI